MKFIVVARNKFQIGVFLVLSFIGISLVRWLGPEGYGTYVNIAWLAWFLVLAWLAWSIVAPLLMVKKVDLDPLLSGAVDDLNERIKNIESDRGRIASSIGDAQAQLKELQRLVVGFVEQAERLREQQQALAEGSFIKIGSYDFEFANMLRRLDENQRNETAEGELSILMTFERSMREQAEALRKKIVLTRSLVYQQQLKLKGTEAEVPLLKIGSALGESLALLPHWNYTPTGLFGLNIKRELSYTPVRPTLAGGRDGKL